MAGQVQRERLQPSLLDRLRLDGDERGFTEQRLREAVRRDLAWLFNCSNLACAQDLGTHPEVSSSVINFGLPALAGFTLAGRSTEELEDAFRQALIDFEPRLLRSSVRVHLDKDATEMNHNALVFTISAQLWAEPVPLHVLMHTEVDLESGSVSLHEGSAR